jgi:hypothetical protein
LNAFITTESTPVCIQKCRIYHWMHSELQKVGLHAFRSAGDITEYIQIYRMFPCVHSEVQEVLLDAFSSVEDVTVCSLTLDTRQLHV